MTKEETKPKEEAKEETKPKVKLTPEQIVRKDLTSNINALVVAVDAKDWAGLAKVIRRSNSIRSRITIKVLKESITKYVDAETVQNMYGAILLWLDSKIAEEEAQNAAEMDTKEETKEEEPKEEKTKEQLATEKVKKELEAALLKKAKQTPEVAIYVHLLTTGILIDHDQDEALKFATSNVSLIHTFNRRTMDQLSASAYLLYSLTHEHVGKLSSIRRSLIAAHRSACLQHNEHGQAALTVCILRNYLHYNLYSQADKFRRTTNFPETRSTNLFARYLYYTGRINAIQLQYSDAFANLSQAIRKSPQNTALGFRSSAQKLLILVQLLMGEIPERSVFLQEDLKEQLEPYFRLTQAVRVGDVVGFGTTAEGCRATWETDNVYSLIVRLRNNVIKTGLRKINLSYSRISIADVCAKLNLGTEESTEHIVAKAIHDGVIDAVIDRSNKTVFCRATGDVYSTMQPQNAFHKRILFCMDIHNDAVKALKYPPNAHNPKKDQGPVEVDLDELDVDSDDDEM